MRSDWQEQAVCASVEPELFYPAPQEHVRRRQAKAVCKSCPVVNECLQWALDTDDQFAILGGTTAAERDVLRGKKGRPRRTACKQGHPYELYGVKGVNRWVCRQCVRDRASAVG